LINTPSSDDLVVRILNIGHGTSSTGVCQQQSLTNHQSSQSAVIEEELVWMGFMTVDEEPVIGDVGESVKTGEFGERQKLGVVKALHEESATWLTGNSVDEQRQSKQQNPRPCHVVSGDYSCDRKYPVNEIRKWRIQYLGLRHRRQSTGVHDVQTPQFSAV